MQNYPYYRFDRYIIPEMICKIYKSTHTML